MSTRSTIAIELPNGHVKSIYCHFDGYFAGVGATLLEHYSDRAKVEELIALGDISALGEEIGEKHDFDAEETPQTEHWTKAYGRDRGEENTAAEEYVNRDAYHTAFLCCALWQEYAYLFGQDGTWYYAQKGGGWAPLAGAQEEQEED